MVTAHYEVLEYVIDQSYFLVNHSMNEGSNTAVVLPADTEPKDKAILNKSLIELPVSQIGICAV